MKSVLVTGADGIVGKRLIEKLVKEGIVPEVFVRTDREKAFFDSHKVEMIVGSAKDSSLLESLVKGKEAVIHLIGSFAPENGDSLDDVNNMISYNLLNAAQDNGVQKFIYLSAYGASVAVRNPFLVSKGNAEVDIMQGEVPYFILKAAPIYSKETCLGELLQEFVQTKKAQLIGTGKQQIQPIFLDDVIEYLYQALVDPNARQQVLEIGGPDKVSYEELVQLASEVSGQAIQIKKVPSFLKSLLAPVKLKGKLLPEDVVDFYSRDTFISKERADKVIPLTLVSLRDGLKKIL